ncbi:chromosomal replication initiator protein DnaA [Neisseria leonii]|uniref:Chromosomal replication initiator protein DnaA n=1 Tax=Neisseria leonii TaxID=2995413 RepID=A0A9X4E7W7_9NEIS|nr:chromosomal replication initiator protein DnaA [Neisseria sp. 51.81]MDD9328667.1 chromosomal replication initiator protein DnaA [Neisseria sp. 51.81]
MDLADFWPQCLRRLSQMLTPQQFETWIAPLTVGEEAGVWTVYAKNQFCCNMLKTQFAVHLEAVRAELVPARPPLLIKTGRGESYPMAPETVEAQKAAALPGVREMQADFRPSENGAAERVETGETVMRGKAADILSERVRRLSVKTAAEPVSDGRKAVAVPAGSKNDAFDAHTERLKQSNLTPDYLFETLVVGKGNSMAAEAGKAIAENPGQQYNPFFLYGSTGLGKTHLAQAIGHSLLAKNPQAKVCYMHADDYVRGLMAAFRNKGFEAFKQKYKQYDLLIIDDIQFIKGKDRTMEEFFYLFNHFHEKKKQLILTCDVLPARIEELDDRLKSRFVWGLTLELAPPEFEMRVDILRKKAELSGIELSEEVADFIAKHIRSNVRELEGAFKQVEARSRFLNKKVDLDLVRDALGAMVASAYKVITADLIMEEVARHYRIKISDLLGKKRSQNIARPRQIAMCLTKELTNMSLPAIGDAFGGRDHTTVMHGVKKVGQLRSEDPEVAQDYEKLFNLIRN